MGKIKVEDLPEDQKISKEDIRKIFGGTIQQTQLYNIRSRTWAIPEPFRRPQPINFPYGGHDYEYDW